MFNFNINFFNSPIIVLISSIILHSSAVCIRNYMNTEDHNGVITVLHTVMISCISVIIIFVVIIQTFPNLQNRHLWICISMILLLILNFLNIYLYDIVKDRAKHIQAKEFLKQQVNMYIKQYNTIFKNQKYIRLLRHDMKGHISTIKYLLEIGNSQEALSHINNMYNFLLLTDNICVNSGNLAIDSILNTKIQEASSDGINITSKIKIPPELNITSFDLSAILINLLDNALTAVRKIEEKNSRFITVDIELDRGILYIRVSNPFIGSLLYADGHLKTTYSDTQNHGLGLESVKKTVERYDGCMNIKQNCNFFTVNIILYNIQPIILN